MIRILLADDQALLRAGFRMLLESAPDMAVVAEAHNGGQAVALARELRPDIVLMDLKMPEVDGVTATRRITADPQLASVRVVVLTTFGDDQSVFAARLVVSPLTAKTHVSRAMTKLAARDRAQLVVIAYSSGLADPGTR